MTAKSMMMTPTAITPGENIVWRYDAFYSYTPRVMYV
jgi:hypothetical protein